jgi:protein-disulfide isomerase
MGRRSPQQASAQEVKAWLPWIAAVLVGLFAGAGTMTLIERQGGGAVRGYLLAHPEVIPEAMQRLRDRETGKVIAASRAAIEAPVGSAWAGNPHGDVTLVEYYDYNCGYCRASLPNIAALVKADPGVRVVYRELPVLAPSSHDAALASLAAAHAGRFAAFHDALYAAGPVSAATIAAAAKQAGFTPPSAPMPGDEAAIIANMKTAAQLGMTGTPSWVVGDRVLIGAQTLAQLQEAVAAARGS